MFNIFDFNDCISNPNTFNNFVVVSPNAATATATSFVSKTYETNIKGSPISSVKYIKKDPFIINVDDDFFEKLYSKPNEDTIKRTKELLGM